LHTYFSLFSLRRQLGRGLKSMQYRLWRANSEVTVFVFSQCDFLCEFSGKL
jgi:hypothetical protein